MALDPHKLLRAAVGPRVGLSAALAWTAVLLLWFFDAAGFDPPKLLSRAAVVVAAVVLAVWLGRRAWRLWRGEDPSGRWLTQPGEGARW